jgi:hypothetical protein
MWYASVHVFSRFDTCCSLLTWYYCIACPPSKAPARTRFLAAASSASGFSHANSGPLEKAPNTRPPLHSKSFTSAPCTGSCVRLPLSKMLRLDEPTKTPNSPATGDHSWLSASHTDMSCEQQQRQGLQSSDSIETGKQRCTCCMQVACLLTPAPSSKVAVASDPGARCSFWKPRSTCGGSPADGGKPR